MDNGSGVGLLRVQARRRGVGEKSAGIAGEHGLDEAITDLMFVVVFLGPVLVGRSCSRFSMYRYHPCFDIFVVVFSLSLIALFLMIIWYRGKLC